MHNRFANSPYLAVPTRFELAIFAVTVRWDNPYSTRLYYRQLTPAFLVLIYPRLIRVPNLLISCQGSKPLMYFYTFLAPTRGFAPLSHFWLSVFKTDAFDYSAKSAYLIGVVYKIRTYEPVTTVGLANRWVKPLPQHHKECVVKALHEPSPKIYDVWA